MSDLHLLFEVIKGDRGFSEGTLKALFESLERDQGCGGALAREDA